MAVYENSGTLNRPGARSHHPDLGVAHMLLGLGFRV